MTDCRQERAKLLERRLTEANAQIEQMKLDMAPNFFERLFAR